MVETGQKLGWEQLYLATHRNEDGSFVNEASKEICEKNKLALSQSIVDESEISPNDAIGKVLKKEHSGKNIEHFMGWEGLEMVFVFATDLLWGAVMCTKILFKSSGAKFSYL